MREIGAKQVILDFLGGLLAACIVGFCITLPFIVSARTEKKMRMEMQEQIESVYRIMGDMEKTDSVVMNISSLNAEGIERLNRGQEELSSKVKSVERKVNSIDEELDSYD